MKQRCQIYEDHVIGISIWLAQVSFRKPEISEGKTANFEFEASAVKMRLGLPSMVSLALNNVTS